MSKTKVMIVDDDSRIRDLLRIYLIKADFQVIEAEDGITALLLHQQNKPDIILLDIMMPVLDGLETCRQIRKLDSTPIILLTARTEEEVSRDHYLSIILVIPLSTSSDVSVCGDSSA